jgi:hypothetical protein
MLIASLCRIELEFGRILGHLSQQRLNHHNNPAAYKIGIQRNFPQKLSSCKCQSDLIIYDSGNGYPTAGGVPLEFISDISVFVFTFNKSYSFFDQGFLVDLFYS